MPSKFSKTHKKVIFKLIKDADGYPPAEWESVWAIPKEDGLFEIDNVPFYTKNISCGDLVSVKIEDDEYHFNQLIKESKHTTIRVIIFDPNVVQEVRDKLTTLGCSSELSHISKFIAVDIPANVDINIVTKYLDEGENNDDWEYEEGAFRH